MLHGFQEPSKKSQHSFPPVSLSLRICTSGALSYHVKGPTTLKPPCWKGHVERPQQPRERNAHGALTASYYKSLSPPSQSSNLWASECKLICLCSVPKWEMPTKIQPTSRTVRNSNKRTITVLSPPFVLIFIEQYVTRTVGFISKNRVIHIIPNYCFKILE